MDRFTKKFAEIVPIIRESDLAVLKKQGLSGKHVPIEVGGRQVDTYWHRSDDPKAPLILELHGGGMVLGYAAQNDALRQVLADRAGATVIGVDYCKAPENPYPMAIEEMVALIGEIDYNSGKYEIEPSKLAIAGFSAGATLATVVAMRCNEGNGRKVDALMLHYPFVDAVTPPEEKFPYDDALPPEMSRAFNQLYWAEDDAQDPYISPLGADDRYIELLPPAVIVTAENDGLRTEGKAFADRLKSLGTEVIYSMTPEVSHGYIEDYYNHDIYLARGGAEEGTRYDALMKHAAEAFGSSCDAIKGIL